MRIKSLLLCIGFLAFAFCSQAQPVSALKTHPWDELKADISKASIQDVKLATVITINPVTLQNWYAMAPPSIRLSIPGLRTVTVYKTDIFADDFAVTTSDGRRIRGKEYEGIHYQSDTGFATLSIFKGNLMAVISANGTQYNLGPDPDNPKRYLLTRESDLGPNPFRCHTEDQDEHPGRHSRNNQGAEKSALSVSCKVVKIGFEVDSILFRRAGGTVQKATNYVSGLFNSVKLLYRKEKIALQLGSVFVWTTRDPYINSSSTNQILYDFATNRPVSGFGSNNLLHLLSARVPILGGIGYVGVLCNTSVRHAFSSIYYEYLQLPTYSWSVYCVSHELGHNFGSRHTHWCGWTLPNGTTGRIDSCAAGEGSCGSTTRPRRGTIMSYCHITSGGIDFNLGFGNLPGDAVRKGLADATCVPLVASASCDSLEPVIQPSGQCVEQLLHYVNAAGKSCFSFKIKPGCRYTLNYCRYDGYSQSNPPPAAAVPTQCAIRNNINNYLPTATQLAAGKIDLVAADQPWTTGRWYSVKCQGSDGISQLHFFWWP